MKLQVYEVFEELFLHTLLKLSVLKAKILLPYSILTKNILRPDLELGVVTHNWTWSFEKKNSIYFKIDRGCVFAKAKLDYWKSRLLSLFDLKIYIHFDSSISLTTLILFFGKHKEINFEYWYHFFNKFIILLLMQQNAKAKI